MSSLEGKVAFAVGTGRCGTHFIAKAVGLEPRIASAHERNALNETFHRYCKWHQLPVDHEGFLHTKQVEILEDLKDHQMSFEASAYLSLSIRELYDRFGARFLLVVRSPEAVVNSYLKKGWYLNPIVRHDPQLAVGYQQCDAFHHFLGRTVPSGPKFEQWRQMSRVGKLAWYWHALNSAVIEQFKHIPESHWRVQKLEELSYDRYVEIARFIGFEPTVQRQAYEQLATSRPDAFSNLPTIRQWSETEVAEFESEVGPTAELLGYEYRVADLIAHAAQAEPAMAAAGGAPASHGHAASAPKASGGSLRQLRNMARHVKSAGMRKLGLGGDR